VEPRLIPAENNIELIVAIGETKQMSQKEKIQIKQQQQQSCGEDKKPVWHSSASPVELFFIKQLHEQLHERGREPCFCSFTMCLTL
jgi:hypothetical protein